jgi:hypothetical protein
MIDLKTTADGLHLKVYVQPRSSRNQITGAYRGALKLKITSPPVDGAANKACIRFLAKRLGIAPSRIEIVSGHTARTKRLLIRAGAAEVSKIEQNIRSCLPV